MPERGLMKDGQYRHQNSDRAPVPDGWVIVPLRPSALHEWSDGAWIEGDPPEPAVPPTIGVAQLLIGLSHPVVGWITEAEALAWGEGSALPAAAEATISGLPAEHRNPARLRLLRMASVDRNHWLVDAMAAAEGKTPAEVDDFFRFCASL